jgi:CrcB protein
MNILLAVASGGAIGALGRHIINSFVMNSLHADFPWGLMVVNILGSFVIGCLVVVFAHVDGFSQSFRAFLVVGVLGGFTTFSAFSLDVILLFEKGQYASALFYSFGTFLLAIMAAYAGMSLTRMLVS